MVDQAFCSSWGDDALELLGDLAFQDGRFGEALAAYGRIVADRPDDPFMLVHPDPSVDLARVAAKKLLCRAAAGENPPGPADLNEFATRYPGATGKLAGRTGAYSEILAEALESDQLGPAQRARQPLADLRRVVPANQARAGADRRGLDAVAGRAREGLVRPRCRVSIPAWEWAAGPVTAAPERLLAFHPIVLGDQVIVCDGSRVLAFNLNDRPRRCGNQCAAGGRSGLEVSGRRRCPGSAGAALEPGDSSVHADGLREPHLRADGAAERGLSVRAWDRRASNSIVALDWSTQGKFLWEQRSSSLALPNRPPDRNNNRTVSFEGTPVADERNVYVAVTDRREQTATYIACFDADSGAVRWVRYVGAASPEGDNNIGFMGGMQASVTSPGDFNHRLLSLDGSTLYYQTNLGALAAIDAATGSTLWVASYPRQEPSQSAAASSAT